VPRRTSSKSKHLRPQAEIARRVPGDARSKKWGSFRSDAEEI
jgi:hypothetical protein